MFAAPLCSADGFVKFWKKLPGSIEFIKAYRAHTSPVLALCGSADGCRVVSLGADRLLRFYDALSADCIDMIRLTFPPTTAAVCAT